MSQRAMGRINNEWKDRAACKGLGDLDPDLFFNKKRLDWARIMCEGCPVREECAEAGVGEYGTWAGEFHPVSKTTHENLAVYLRPGCGTQAGHRRHLRAHEKPCQECTRAASQASFVSHHRSRP